MNIYNQCLKDNYALYQGDSIEISSQIPDESIHYSIFSPPFPELYTYSDSPNDLGNSKNYIEFFEHFDYLVKELFRIIKKGRLITIHCTDIPIMKERDGYIGLKDFPGDIIKAFQKIDFIYHSRHTIWKDPLIEATRTKSLSLLYKQTLKDSSMCRAGMPDYLITMRKPGENPEPIKHEKNTGFGKYIGEDNNKPTANDLKYNHEVWQKYASPVWMDIRQTDTLSYREARDEKDEKHICPLQLDTIERCVVLWTNPNDIIYSPFAGIGSEGYISILKERKFIGIELKESYYKQMEKNMKLAEKERDKFKLF